MRGLWIAVLVLGLMACGKEQGPKPTTQDVTFEVLSKGAVVDLESHVEQGRITVFDFYADWCAPCKKLERSLKDLKRVYGDRLEVYQLDLVSWDSELAKHHGIKDLPYLMVYTEEGELLKAGPSNQVLPELVKRLNAGKS